MRAGPTIPMAGERGCASRDSLGGGAGVNKGALRGTALCGNPRRRG
jgi:hypothetical protein